jgi:hypothetical protein
VASLDHLPTVEQGELRDRQLGRPLESELQLGNCHLQPLGDDPLRGFLLAPAQNEGDGFTQALLNKN